MYPDNIQKLILLSPLGIPRDSGKSSGLKAKLWENNFNPINLIRWADRLGRLDKSLTDYCNQRTLIRSDDEKSVLKEFMKQSILRPQSSEVAITHILTPNKFAKFPLIDDFTNLSLPILILFGDDDWMLHQLQDSDQEIDIPIIQVEIAGHHLHLDNPIKTNYHVMNFIDE